METRIAIKQENTNPFKTVIYFRRSILGPNPNKTGKNQNSQLSLQPGHALSNIRGIEHPNKT